MSKLNPLAALGIATLSALLLSGPAMADGAKTRADIIAELKAAHESGEMLARAMEMEGVGHVMPVSAEARGGLFAKGKKPVAKPSAKAEAGAEATASAPAVRAQRGSETSER